jgi:hypothetical protein
MGHSDVRNLAYLVPTARATGSGHLIVRAVLRACMATVPLLRSHQLEPEWNDAATCSGIQLALRRQAPAIAG